MDGGLPRLREEFRRTQHLMEMRMRRKPSVQEYVWAGTEIVTRADGSGLVLDVWLTNCVYCGDEFVVKARAGDRKHLNRRCERHRYPGMKTKVPMEFVERQEWMR